MKRLAIATTAFVSLALPAVASPMVYACEPQGGGGPPAAFFASDRLIIDPQAGTLELGVVASLGTDNPINWTFRTDEVSDDVSGGFVMEQREGGIAGAGIFLSFPFSFHLSDSGVLLWAFIAPDSDPSWMRWTCLP